MDLSKILTPDEIANCIKVLATLRGEYAAKPWKPEDARDFFFFAAEYIARAHLTIEALQAEIKASDSVKAFEERLNALVEQQKGFLGWAKTVDHRLRIILENWETYEAERRKEQEDE